MKKSILFILLLIVCNAFANDKIYQAYLNAKQYEDYSSEMNFDVKDKVTLKQFNKWLDTNGEYVQINLNSQNNISIGEAVGNTIASLLFDTSTANIEIIKNNDLINIQYKRIFMYGCSHDLVLKVNFIKKSNVNKYFNYIQQQIELQKQRNYENSLKEAIMFGIGLKLTWEGTKWAVKKGFEYGLLSFNNSDSDSSQSSNSEESNNANKINYETIVAPEVEKSEVTKSYNCGGNSNTCEAFYITFKADNESKYFNGVLFQEKDGKKRYYISDGPNNWYYEDITSAINALYVYKKYDVVINKNKAK